MRKKGVRCLELKLEQSEYPILGRLAMRMLLKNVPVDIDAVQIQQF